MQRLTAPVLLTAIALAISAIALPAIGYVPWQTRPDAQAAKPAQIKAMVKVDPADARASSLTALRALAQDSLQSLTDRDQGVARDRLAEMQQAWLAQQSDLRGSLAARWEPVDQALRKAVTKLSPGNELFISKAAVLDLLSALDAASAPTPAVVASADSSAPASVAVAVAGPAAAETAATLATPAGPAGAKP